MITWIFIKNNTISLFLILMIKKKIKYKNKFKVQGTKIFNMIKIIKIHMNYNGKKYYKKTKKKMKINKYRQQLHMKKIF